MIETLFVKEVYTRTYLNFLFAPGCCDLCTSSFSHQILQLAEGQFLLLITCCVCCGLGVHFLIAEVCCVCIQQMHTTGKNFHCSLTFIPIMQCSIYCVSISHTFRAHLIMLWKLSIFQEIQLQPPSPSPTHNYDKRRLMWSQTHPNHTTSVPAEVYILGNMCSMKQ